MPPRPPPHVRLELGNQRILKIVSRRRTESSKQIGSGDRLPSPPRGNGHATECSCEAAVCRPPRAVLTPGERSVRNRKECPPAKPRQTGRPPPDVFMKQRSRREFDARSRGPLHHRPAESVRKTVWRPAALVQLECLIKRGFHRDHTDPLPIVGSCDILVPALLQSLRGLAKCTTPGGNENE